MSRAARRRPSRGFRPGLCPAERLERRRLLTFDPLAFLPDDAQYMWGMTAGYRLTEPPSGTNDVGSSTTTFSWGELNGPRGTTTTTSSWNHSSSSTTSGDYESMTFTFAMHSHTESTTTSSVWTDTGNWTTESTSSYDLTALGGGNSNSWSMTYRMQSGGTTAITSHDVTAQANGSSTVDRTSTDTYTIDVSGTEGTGVSTSHYTFATNSTSATTIHDVTTGDDAKSLDVNLTDDMDLLATGSRGGEGGDTSTYSMNVGSLMSLVLDATHFESRSGAGVTGSDAIHVAQNKTDSYRLRATGGTGVGTTSSYDLTVSQLARTIVHSAGGGTDPDGGESYEADQDETAAYDLSAQGSGGASIDTTHYTLNTSTTTSSTSHVTGYALRNGADETGRDDYDHTSSSLVSDSLTASGGTSAGNDFGTASVIRSDSSRTQLVLSGGGSRSDASGTVVDDYEESIATTRDSSLTGSTVVGPNPSSRYTYTADDAETHVMSGHVGDAAALTVYDATSTWTASLRASGGDNAGVEFSSHSVTYDRADNVRQTSTSTDGRSTVSVGVQNIYHKVVNGGSGVGATSSYVFDASTATTTDMNVTTGDAANGANLTRHEFRSGIYHSSGSGGESITSSQYSYTGHVDGTSALNSHYSGADGTGTLTIAATSEEDVTATGGTSSGGETTMDATWTTSNTIDAVRDLSGSSDSGSFHITEANSYTSNNSYTTHLAGGVETTTFSLANSATSDWTSEVATTEPDSHRTTHYSGQQTLNSEGSDVAGVLAYTYSTDLLESGSITQQSLGTTDTESGTHQLHETGDENGILSLNESFTHSGGGEGGDGPVLNGFGAGDAGPPGSGGFWDSLKNSWGSMNDTYTSMILYAMGHRQEAQEFMDRAYNRGPLGQTKDSSGVYYYGTRGALTVATVSASLALGAGIAEVAGAPQFTVIVTSRGNPFHVIFQAGMGTEWIHATGVHLGRLRVAHVGANTVLKMVEGQIFKFSGPILFSGAAGETGQRALTCVTAAVHAYLKGWLPFLP